MSGRGRGVARGLILTAVALLLLVPIGVGTPVRSVPPPPTIVRTAPIGAGAFGLLPPITSTTPFARATLEEWNRTLVPGFPAGPTSANGLLSLALDPAGGRGFVGTNSNSVAEFNLTTGAPGQMFGEISVADPVFSLAYDPNSNTVYAGLQNSHIQAILANGSVSWVPLTGSNPYALLDVPSSNRLYSANYNSGDVSVIATNNNSVVQTITVGGANCEPDGLALDAQTNQLIVAETGAFSVAIVNLSTGSVNATVKVGNGPDSVALDPVNGTAYVPNVNSNTVSVINVSTAKVVATIPVGNSPTAAAYDPDTHEVWVANFGSNNISVIQVYNKSVVSSVQSGGPDAIAYNPIAGELAVVGQGGGYVTVFNATNSTEVREIDIAPQPLDATYDPGNGEVYVTSFSQWGIHVINGSDWHTVGFLGHGGWYAAGVDVPLNELFAVSSAGVLGEFNATSFKLLGTAGLDLNSASGGVDSVVADPLTNQVFVSNGYSNNVSVVNASTDKVITSIGVGQQPVGIAYDPRNDTIWVADQASNDVYVISAKNDSVVEKISPGCNPWSFAYVATTNMMFVSDACTNLAASYNATTYAHVRTVGVGQGPVALVADNRENAVFSANYNSGNISVLNGSTGRVITSVRSEYYLTGLALDPTTQVLFAVDNYNETVEILGIDQTLVDFQQSGFSPLTPWSVTLDGERHNTTTSTIPFFASLNSHANFTVPNASGLAPTPRAGNLTVGTSNVLITVHFGLLAYYRLQFNETGLPPGTPWTIDLNGTLLSSNGSSLAIAEPNGTYGYVAGRWLDFYGSPSNGTLRVAGSALYVSLSYSERFLVTFTELGLRSGLKWSVTIGGHASNSSNSSAMTFREANGTGYSYMVAPVTGYRAQPGTGAFNVTGGPVNVTVQFVEVFSVTFTESGLPSGTRWRVDLNSTRLNSTGKTIEYNESNGTYDWRVSPVPGYATNWTGNVTVADSAVTVNVNFHQVAYTIDFAETGLPVGTNWSVRVGSQTEFSGGGPTILLVEPNGTYSYRVAPVPGYSAQWTGTTLVENGSVNVTVAFVPFTFAVTFNEVGLPAGTVWNVTLGGEWRSAGGQSVTFVDPNGSYSWSIVPIPGFTTNWSGELTVDNASWTVTVDFAPFTYFVWFNETGLPPGTMWQMTADGTTERSTTTSIAYLVTNGSYPYVVGGVPGWTLASFGGSVAVDGRPVGVLLRWVHVVYSIVFTETGLPAGTTWWLNLSGQAAVPAETNTTSISEPNGSYSYSIASADKGYVGHSGTLVEDGSTFAVSVSFTRGTFNGSVNESGLPADTLWWFNISGGTPLRTHGSLLAIALMTGSYSYTIGSSDKRYRALAGSLVVDGPSFAQEIAFVPVTFNVTFVATGLPAGAPWSVSLNGISESGFAAIEFTGLTNGTYQYSVSAANGYSGSIPTGSITVSGAPLTLNETFVAPAQASSGPAAPGPQLLLALAVAILVVGALSLLLLRRRRLKLEQDLEPEGEVASDLPDPSLDDAAPPPGPE